MTTTATKKWDKESMITALDTKYDNKSFLKVVKVIYDRQTQDEKASQQTKHSNGMGFNGRDGGYMTGVYERAIKRTPEPFLTPKEFEAARKIMRKYAGQLCAVANGFGK